jgi:hypothetical protein
VLVTAAIALLAVAGFVQELRRIDRNAAPEPADVRWAAARLRAATPPGSLVAGDVPIVPFLADRRFPGQLIDTSRGRILGGVLGPTELFALLERTHVRAVVVGRLFLAKPQIVAGIARRYPRKERHGSITIYYPARAR